MFSSISRQLIGDDSLIHDLRVLSSKELRDCADYCSTHPLFLKIIKQNDIFSGKNCLENIVMCLSDETMKLETTSLIKRTEAEALHTREDKIHAGFLNLLALSNVLRLSIKSWYPDFGAAKYKVVFNSTICPTKKQIAGSSNCLNILFCFLGNRQKTFTQNHFVPLISMKLTSLQEKMHSSRCGSIKSYFPVSSSMTTKKLCKTHVIENVAEQVSNPVHDLGDAEPELLFSNLDVNTLKRKASTELPVPVSDERKISILENGEYSNETLASVDVSGIDYVGSNVEVRPKTCDIAKFRTELKDLNGNDRIKRKIEFIENVWKPDKNYIFPYWQNGQRFSHSWLQNYKWLHYSTSENGGYCLYCVLFADDTPGKHANLQVLYTKPLKERKTCTDILKNHNPSNDDSKKKTTFIL